MKQLLVNCEQLQNRVALAEDGRIEEYCVEREGAYRSVGSIYKGRIRNLENSLQAAFVDIGLKKNAFLHYWDMVPSTEDTWDEDDDDDDADTDADDDGDDLHATDSQDGSDRRRRSRRRRRNRNRGGGGGGNNSDTTVEEADEGASDAPDEVDAVEATSESDGSVEPVSDHTLAQRFFSVVRGCLPANKEAEEAGAEVEAAPVDEPAVESAVETLDVAAEPQADPTAPADESPSEQRQGRSRGRRRRGGRNRRRRGGGNGSPADSETVETGDSEAEEAPDGEVPESDFDASDSGGNDGSGKSGNRSRRRGGRSRKRPQVDIEQVPKNFPVDSEVVVQVSKGMIGDKGPRVTTNLSIPGRYLVLLPNSDHRGVSKRISDRKERQRLRKVLEQLEMPRGVGCICRTASIGLEADALQRDIDLLLEKWTLAQQRIKDKRAPVWVYQEPGLVERTVRDLLAEGIDEIVIDSKHMYDMILQYVRRLDPKTQTKVKLYTDPTPIFDHYRISDQIADIFCRKVPLASGAELCLDETEALIAIDINSGKSRGGKDHPETILNTNLEAAEEVARQLRLRNVGGLVVIDFIDMRSRKDRSEVYKQFKKALSRDRAKTKVVPISALGLMEMTRQREHASLQDANYEKCDYCNGRGLVKSSTTVSVEIQRRLREVMQRYEGKVPIRIIVHPDVLARLRDQDADILEQMEADFGGELSFRADDSVHQEDFKILNQQTGKEV